MATKKAKTEKLEIKNFVIHQLLKVAGNRNVREKEASGLIVIGDKEKKFLNKLDRSYHKKSNPIYGIFADENPIFKNLLIDYNAKKIDFLNFSLDVMKLYKSVLHNTVAATGGYMILCEYYNTVTLKNSLLVLMINNKEGFVVNEQNLTLDDIKNLDLSKVDVACLINLTDWINIENNSPTDRKTYLSFVKGMKDVSYYFMSFIDVDNKSTTTESTNRLLKAMDDYFSKNNLDRSSKTKKRYEVYQYCHKCIDAKKEILLSVISSIINPELPEEFLDFATDEEYKVSSIISGDKNKMRILQYVKYNSDDFKIEFDTKLLTNKTIHLDDKTKNLTIKNISDELFKMIKDA